MVCKGKISEFQNKGKLRSVPKMSAGFNFVTQMSAISWKYRCFRAQKSVVRGHFANWRTLIYGFPLAVECGYRDDDTTLK